MSVSNIQFNNIKNKNFNYIHFHFRREWIKLLYPHMAKFLQAIINIPWSTYTYNGDAFFTTEIYNNVNHSSKTIYSTEKVKVEGLNYHLFGGSVAEILNYAYRAESGINIRDYIDPTGDFDVDFYYEKLMIVDERGNKKSLDYDMYNVAYNDNKEISPFIEDMTRWIFEQFSNQLQNVVTQYNISHVENDTAKSYKLDYSSETCKRKNLSCNDDDPLFLMNSIGDYTVIRKTEPDMIKIQLTISMQTRDTNNIMESNQYTDHLIEFVMTTKDDIANIGSKRNPSINVHGVNILQPGVWFYDQGRAYIDRAKRIYAQEEKEHLLNQHKVINHIRRMEYILTMAYFLDTKFPGTLFDIYFRLDNFINHQIEMKNNRAVSLPMPMIQINRKRSVPANVYFKHYVEKYEGYKHEKEEKERELEEEQYRKRLEYIATRYQNIKPKLQEKLRTNENFKNKFVNALKDMKNVNHDTTLVTDENIAAQVERIGTYSILREYNLLEHLKGGMRKKTRKHKRKTTKRRFTQRR